jgi:hypothetical protein
MHLIQLMNHVPLWLVGLIVMIAAQTYAIGLMLLTRGKMCERRGSPRQIAFFCCDRRYNKKNN